MRDPAPLLDTRSPHLGVVKMADRPRTDQMIDVTSPRSPTAELHRLSRADWGDGSLHSVVLAGAGSPSLTARDTPALVQARTLPQPAALP